MKYGSFSTSEGSASHLKSIDSFAIGPFKCGRNRNGILKGADSWESWLKEDRLRSISGISVRKTRTKGATLAANMFVLLKSSLL